MPSAKCFSCNDLIVRDPRLPVSRADGLCNLCERRINNQLFHIEKKKVTKPKGKGRNQLSTTTSSLARGLACTLGHHGSDDGSSRATPNRTTPTGPCHPSLRGPPAPPIWQRRPMSPSPWTAPKPPPGPRVDISGPATQPRNPAVSQGQKKMSMGYVLQETGYKEEPRAPLIKAPTIKAPDYSDRMFKFLEEIEELESRLRERDSELEAIRAREDRRVAEKMRQREKELEAKMRKRDLAIRKEIDRLREKLGQSEKSLAETQSGLQTAQKQLFTIKSYLGKSNSELETAKKELSKVQNELEESKEQDRCKICYNKPNEPSFIIPCGHGPFCTDCALDWGDTQMADEDHYVGYPTCPVCRGIETDFVRVYV
ncbi:hypothetical protein B0H67DRAFT_555051 [Lasiosphaeris hirsuta]|uniref:RING-type domain-containing protein n=1 Tax=Lasiosphaeris hirsuta TaxID=260670 RepID=A0AA40DT49_9PEZI|nr:hypothetical protein B0H67DRAFT_555051 [Lasiosphaeris hirsuta]